MNYKLIVAEALQEQIGDTLSVEAIFNLLEKPKSGEH